MTVLAIMQNQWFKDPARVAAIFRLRRPPDTSAACHLFAPHDGH